jgi:DNA-binding NtrC family response regulator
MRKRVLVVDDVTDWRNQLQAILKTEFEVMTVDSYRGAMDIIRQRGAELVIVDLRLSPIDEADRQGMELLKQLAEHRINAIVLTGYPEEELRREAEEQYGIFDFIDKGVLAHNVQRLRDTVREAFDLMEPIEKAKTEAINKVKALQSVYFPDNLSSWPLSKHRKDK